MVLTCPLSSQILPDLRTFVASEALAGVVSPESRFAPFTIRINSRAPLGQQPATKADVIEVAASSEATCHDIHIGPDGRAGRTAQTLNLSIPAAFARCLNLKAPATPSDSYCCLSVKVGAGSQGRAGAAILLWT